MKPVLFEIPKWLLLSGTGLFAFLLLFLERKEPLKAKMITAGSIILAFILEVKFVTGSLDVPAYGFMIMTAFISGTYLAAYRAKRWGLDPNNVIDSGLFAVIFGILGARTLFIIQYFDVYFWGTGYHDGEPYNRFFNVFKIWQGGLVFYGGLIGGAAAIIILLKKRKQNLPLMADLCLPSVMLGLAITRIGCFLNGCCFGKITSSVWGVRYGTEPFESRYVLIRQMEQIKMLISRYSYLLDPSYYAAKLDLLNTAIEHDPSGILSPRVTQLLDEMRHLLAEKGVPVEDMGYHTHCLLTSSIGDFPLPVHPTQIYASIMGFAIFAILMILTRFRKFDGQIGTLFGMLYAVNRFTIELFRSDNNTNLGLTISQWISAGLFCGSAALYMYFRKKNGLTELPIAAKKGSGQKTDETGSGPEDNGKDLPAGVPDHN